MYTHTKYTSTQHSPLIPQLFRPSSSSPSQLAHPPFTPHHQPSPAPSDELSYIQSTPRFRIVSLPPPSSPPLLPAQLTPKRQAILFDWAFDTAVRSTDVQSRSCISVLEKQGECGVGCGGENNCNRCAYDGMGMDLAPRINS